MLKTTIEFDALGTRWWIDLPSENDKLKEKILDKVNDFQAKYSRFNEKSELYKLNKNKVYENPSSEFLDLINYGLEMYKKTDGLFNISVGAKLESEGYGKVTTKGAVISKNLINDVIISSQKIEISDKTTLDFGGFGKGWLIDDLGKIINNHGINSFLINGGGDILVGEESQEIIIEHPLKPGYSIKSIILKNQSLASSSALKRTWKNYAQETKSHIINPFGEVKSDILSMHVIANTALLADTLATVFLFADEASQQKLSKKFNLRFFGVTK